MPTRVETLDRTARNPDRPDHGGGVFSVLGVELTALLAALLLILIAVSVFPSQQSVASLAAYLPLQSVLQMFVIVVSILIFAVGWVAYSRERIGNSVLLSCAFLAVGLIDFAYTMAFPGMPDFVTPSSEAKAIDFWLAARGLVACALLSAALRPWRPFASPRTRYWLLVAALGITALVYWLVLYFEGALPATFIPGQGPTAFKTGAEYTLIAVYALAAAVFFARLRIERADYLRRLFTACCVILLSELFFTFYGDVTGINNLPGHLYDAIAYLLIYQALSVRGTQEPYQRLQQSRQPPRANLERRRRGLVSDWWRVGLSPDWDREQDGAAAQAMLAAIVENSNTAIIGCALDGTILSWNAAAERMFGWPTSEAIGQPVAIITPPQHHGLLQPLFEQAARGEPVGQIESCHLRRDGTCLDTAGTLVAIRDANGESVFSTLTLWDITQQKQLERAMQQKAALNELLTERLQRALDGSNLALFDVDLNTGEVYLSEAWAAMLGEEPKPIIDTYENLITRVHPEETERVNKQFYDALKGRIPAYDVVHRVMSRTGEWKWIHSRAKVVERDENGRALRLTGVNADITERVRSEQEIARLNQSLEQRVAERTRQLEATNKELEAFSYSVSHDLRAPLRGIDGFSQLLLQKYAGQLDATGSDYLQRIRRAGLRMAELIDDLLQLSRVSRSQIRTEPLDLSRLARSILATLREREPERRVVTDVQDGVELNADPHLLKIVLENLLGNAWKFTGKREEATIRVEAREQDGEMVVFVKDNGAGFDIKYAHKLFGAFQRLHGAAEFEGTGIGLATVQRIINLHGGRIWADSTLGTGATFYFVIPRALRHETTTA
ncbi:MAG: PAS domain S-box protein [Betaproteobacteria bacterium]|nr:PAS domain S-box protein [Betaproteobacteria bacterium]